MDDLNDLKDLIIDAVPDDPFLVGIRKTVQAFRMVEEGERVLVAVSGGPDSVALLHALYTLRHELAISLVVAHLDHGFRGEESAAEARYVALLCQILGIDCVCEKADVPALRKERHLSAQETARAVRHEFLRRVALERSAQRIALAHTSDDRVETMLLNILRGTGIDGLIGFPPVSANTSPNSSSLIRPLYHERRVEVEAYCARYHLAPRHDSSNAKPHYRRNRLRLAVLPTLREHFNPAVDAALLRLSDLSNEDNMLLEELAEDALHRIGTLYRAWGEPDETSQRFLLDRGKLRQLPRALQRRVLRKAIETVRGTLQDVAYVTIDRIVEALGRDIGKIPAYDLPRHDGVTVRLLVDADTIIVLREEERVEEPLCELAVIVPGITELPDGEWLMTVRCRGAELATVGELADMSLQPALSIWRAAEIEMPLLVRSWRSGDRIDPRGMLGTKKLQDLFIDSRIPKGQRLRVPLLVDGGGDGRILSVGGWRYDRRAVYVGRGLPQFVGESDSKENFDALKLLFVAQEELLVVIWGYE